MNNCSTYIQSILVALLLLPCLVQGQKMHVTLKLISLYSTNLSDGCCNTPDPRWKFDVTATYNNQNIRSGGNWKKTFQSTRNSGTWDISDETVIDNDINLSSGTFDLCDRGEVYINIDFEAWEDDRGSSTSYDCCNHWKNDDDSHRHDDWTILLSSISSAEGTRTFETVHTSFSAKWQLSYDIDVFDADVLAITNRGNVDQDVFCSTDGARISAKVFDEFTDGNWEWRRRAKGSSNSWVSFGASTRFPYVNVSSSDAVNYDYRLRLLDQGNCIGQNISLTTESASVTVVQAAPDPSTVNVVGSSFCGSGTGTVTVADIDGVTSSDLYEMTLISNNGGGIAVGNRTSFPAVWNNLAAGTYSMIYTRKAIVGQDQFGACSKEKFNIQVVGNPLPVISLGGKSDITCLNADDGSISIVIDNANGISGSRTFAISPGTNVTNTQNNHTFNGLAPGNYAISVITPAGCTSNVVNVRITEPSSALGISNTLQSTYEILCNNGTVTVPITPTGGTGPYKITAQNTAYTGITGSFNAPFDFASTQTIQIEDSRGCVYTTPSFTVTDNPFLSVSESTTSGTGCVDSVTSTGTVTITFSGGKGPYTYMFDGGAATVAVSPLTIMNVEPGSHSVTVTDANGCSNEVMPFVDAIGSINPQQRTNFPALTPIYCAGGSNGIITIDFDIAPDSLIFNKVGATQSVVDHGTELTVSYNNLDAGIYELIAIPGGGACEERILINMPDGRNPVIEALEVNRNAPCLGGTGELLVSTSGKSDGLVTTDETHPDRVDKLIATHESGTLNIEYQSEEDNGVITNTIFGNDPFGGDEILVGDYSAFQVQTVQGCISDVFSKDITVFEPSAIDIVFTSTDETCVDANDGTISLTITGGTPPYAATLFKGCSIIGSLVNITNGTGFFGDLAPGDGASEGAAYSVQVSDANNCRGEYPVTIVECPDNGIVVNAAPVITVNVTSTGEDIDCRGNNGELTVTVLDGSTDVTANYEFSLDGVAFQASSVLLGAEEVNTVYVRDLVLGCVYTQNNASIDYFTNEVQVSGDITTFPTNCSDGVLNVSVTNGVAPFTIKVLWTDPNDEPSFSCNDDNTYFATTTSSRSIDVDIIPGRYSICITDAVECEYFSAVEPAATISGGPLSIVVTGSSGESCDISPEGGVGADGSFSVSVSGGNSPYTITKFFTEPVVGSSATFSNLTAGRYSFEVTDADGCIAQVVDSIGKTAGSLQASFITTASVAGCVQNTTGAAEVTISGGNAPYNFEYGVGFDMDNMITGSTSDKINISNANTLEFQVYIIDQAGCELSLPITIPHINGVTDSIALTTSTTNADCGQNNGSISVSGIGGDGSIQYSLDNSSFQTDGNFAGLGQGDYNLFYRDGAGCLDSSQITIAENAAISAIASPSPTSCFGVADGSISVSASGGIGAFQYSLDGGAFQSSPTFSGLPADTFEITIRDGASCDFVISDVVVAEPATISASVNSLTNVSCFGFNDGLITVQVDSGGIGSFQYAIDGTTFTPSPTFILLEADTYTVSIRDDNNCTTEITDIILSEPTQLSLSIDSTNNESCTNRMDGRIFAAGLGGTSPLQYSIDDISYDADSIFTNLDEGTYTVYIQDANGCEASVPNVVVEQTTDMILSTVVDQNTNCNSATGQATVSITTGGTAPFMYNWDGGFATTVTASNLSEGLHTVEVTDVNGCIVNAQVTIAALDAPNIQVDSTNNPACAQANGSIYLSAVGGITPYTYSWSHNNGLTDSFATGLSPDTFQIMVTDGAGCMNSISVILEEIDGPDSLTLNITDVSCVGLDGQIDVQVVGGQAPFSYNWSHDMMLDSNLAEALDTGVYTITVVDANGCIDSLSATIDTADGLQLQVLSVQDATCTASDGSLSVLPIGTAPYTYNWNQDNFLDTNVANNLPAGIYTVEVIDANNCIETLEQEILAQGTIQASIVSTDSAICTAANGTIEVSSTGSAPFTYSWDHDIALNSNIASDLSSGIYQVIITDDNGCIDSIETEVFRKGEITASVVNVDDSRCIATNGEIEVSSDGQAPFSYQWDHDNALNSATAANLAPGDYQAAITDANGCQDSVMQSILSVDDFEVQVDQALDAACAGNNGSISLILNGAPTYTYVWSHDNSLQNSVATGLSAGNYSVVVVDGDGCTDSVSAVLSETVNIQAFVNEQNDAICDAENGSISVVSSGTAPFNFTWSHNVELNENIAENLAPGSYTVIVEDANACFDTLTTEIVSSGMIEASVVDVQNAICTSDNGSISIASSGEAPFIFTWSHDNDLNTSEATGLSAGAYNVIIEDNNGCLDTLNSIGVDIEGSMTATAVASNTGACENALGQIIVEVDGEAPFTFDWSHNSLLNNSIASELAAGDYLVTVSDAFGCIDTAAATVPDPVLLAANIMDEVPVSCLGAADGSAQVAITSSTGNVDILWNDDAAQTTQIATGLVAGDYTVLLTDEAGCQLSLAVNIPNPSVATVSADIENISCNGQADGAAQINIDGGAGPFTFLWNDANAQTTAQATGLLAADYSVQITDANGCEQFVDITITEPEVLTVTANVIDVLCANESNGQAEIVVTGGTSDYTYSWSDNSDRTGNRATDLPMGNYDVQVIDLQGCSDTVSFELNQPTAIDVMLVSLDSASCDNAQDASIEVFAQGGIGNLTYTWDDPLNQTGVKASNLNGGSYTVTVRDGNDCTQDFTVEIDARMTAPVVLLSVDSASCAAVADGQAEVTVTGNTDFSFLWNDPNQQSTALATGLNAGTYVVTATDSNGCGTFLEVDIPSKPEIAITIEDIEAVPCLNAAAGSATALALNGDGNYTYTWNDSLGQTTMVATDLLPGIYSVEVMDGQGCAQTAQVEIPVDSDLSISLLAATAPGCHDSADGSLEIGFEGGTEIESVIWNDPLVQNSALATNLASGSYTVQVTDISGCAVAETFELAGPEALIATASITDASCEGINNGSILVQVEGGTGNYSFDWIGQNVQNEEINTIGVGEYLVLITDSAGCSIEETFAVGADDELDVLAIEIIAPTCDESANGVLGVEISGGLGIYSILWSNGDTSSRISGLNGGEYALMVSDISGCTTVDSFELIADGTIEFDLGLADTTICNNSVLYYDFSQSDLSFNWSGPDGFTAQTDQLEITTSGMYKAMVNNTEGCLAEDSINVSYSESPLQALFIIPTDVVIEDSVVALEVSWPAPAEVDWVFNSESVNYLGANLNQHFFQFNELGETELTLIASEGDCFDAISKTINVHATADSIPELGNVDNREILELSIFPNPNDGAFTALVRLSETMPIGLRVYNVDGTLVESRRLEGQSAYQTAFDLDVGIGLYSLIVNTPRRKQSVLFQITN